MMNHLSSNKKLTVIQFFGGPGVGKSTTAAELFALMKKQGYKVELIHEVAKDFVWERWSQIFTEQDYIFAHQHRLQRRLVDHDIDYVITDSSLLLGLFYLPPGYPESFAKFVREMYDSYTNVNIYLTRNSDLEYDGVGRNQNEEEARKIDASVRNYLDQQQLPYFDVVCGTPVVELLTLLKNKVAVK